MLISPQLVNCDARRRGRCAPVRKAYWRLIPAICLYAFHIVQCSRRSRTGTGSPKLNASAVVDFYAGSGLSTQRGSSYSFPSKISTILLVLADSPCSGSLNMRALLPRPDRRGWLLRCGWLIGRAVAAGSGGATDCHKGLRMSVCPASNSRRRWLIMS